MKKLRLLALMDEVLVPPDDVEGVDVSEAEWKTEFDVVSTLRELGHEVQCLGVGSDLGAIRNAVNELQPHAVFNLLEDFHDVPIYDQNVVSYLELLGVPYTGCNARPHSGARQGHLEEAALVPPHPGARVRRLSHGERGAAPAPARLPAHRQVTHQRGIGRHRADVDRVRRR
jgi:D-alanine-D-alanine ligase